MIKKKKRIQRFHEWDHALALVTLMLSIYGIVMVFSASYYYSISRYGTPYRFLKQNLLWFALGWAVLLLFSRIDYHVLKHISWPCLIVGMLLLLALLVLPSSMTVTFNNATRWLKFGKFTVMPGELIKIFLIIFISAYYSAKPDKAKKPGTAAPIIAVTLAAALMIYKQPNLSTAGIVVFLVFGMMFIAGFPLVYVVGAFAAIIAAAFGAVIFGKGYMLERVITASDPWADPLGDGYQNVQALYALGTGAVKGLGLGNSIEKTLYLPEPQNDFILAIIGEELGFIGIVILLLLFILLIARCVSIALRAPDLFGTLLASGSAILFALHVVLNCAVVSASFPPTGVILPLISLGGNATLVFLSLIGISLNISRQADEAQIKE